MGNFLSLNFAPMSEPHSKHHHSIRAYWRYIRPTLRSVFNFSILIFFLCYSVGALKLRSLLGVPEHWNNYFFVGMVVSIIVTLIVSRRILRKHNKRKFIYIPLVAFAAYMGAQVEFLILMREELFWIILLFSVVALLMTFSEFSFKIRSVWHHEPLSRKDTLMQFVKLYLLSVFAFSLLYMVLQLKGGADTPYFSITHPTDFLLYDFLYFSIVTVSTLGYGDTIPIRIEAKFLVMIQTIIGYLFLSLLLGLMINWLGMRENEN